MTNNDDYKTTILVPRITKLSKNNDYWGTILVARDTYSTKDKFSYDLLILPISM